METQGVKASQWEHSTLGAVIESRYGKDISDIADPADNYKEVVLRAYSDIRVESFDKSLLMEIPLYRQRATKEDFTGITRKLRTLGVFTMTDLGRHVNQPEEESKAES